MKRINGLDQEEGMDFSGSFNHSTYVEIPFGDESESGKIIHLRGLVKSSYEHKSLYAVFKELGEIKNKLNDHDQKVCKEHSDLKQIISYLRVENGYFRNEIKSIYTPNKLSRLSLGFIVFSLLVVVCKMATNIYLVHPVFNVVIIVSASIFYLMSIVMKFQDRSKND